MLRQVRIASKDFHISTKDYTKGLQLLKKSGFTSSGDFVSDLSLLGFELKITEAGISGLSYQVSLTDKAFGQISKMIENLTPIIRNGSRLFLYFLDQSEVIESWRLTFNNAKMTTEEGEMLYGVELLSTISWAYSDIPKKELPSSACLKSFLQKINKNLAPETILVSEKQDRLILTTAPDVECWVYELVSDVILVIRRITVIEQCSTTDETTTKISVTRRKEFFTKSNTTWVAVACHDPIVIRACISDQCLTSLQ